MKYSAILLALILAAASLVFTGCDSKNETSSSSTAAYSIDEQDSQSQSEDGDISIGLEVGMRTPDFTLSLRGGGSVTLSELRGKPVFLNFSATWCPPCRREFPEVQAVYEKYGDSIHVLTICNGEPVEDVDDYFDSLDYNFPIAYCTDDSMYTDYNLEFIPSTWVLDEDGIVVEFIGGAVNEKTMSAAIDRAFK